MTAERKLRIGPIVFVMAAVVAASLSLGGARPPEAQGLSSAK